MARTQAGATLTEAHRQGQARINAQALRQYALVWPLWTGDEASFQRMMEVAALVVASHRALSASFAASYFEAFRAVEKAGGIATPHFADPLPDNVVRGTLHKVGMEMTRDALAGGQRPTEAVRSALVRTSGTVTQFVLDGGRDTIVRSAGEDKKSGGWARVTDANPCAFCLTLASRGPVYSSDTVDFQAHGHCACVGEPFFPGSEYPGLKHKATYDAAIAAARADGTFKKGAQINAVRRYLARTSGG